MWVRAGMCDRGCVFNAGFAVFCAVFRRGEQGCAGRDVLAGMWLAGTVFFLKLLD